MSDIREKLILLILDGWGYRLESDHNATVLSEPKNYNWLLKSNPSILLDASGEHVGLPSGQMGNSEVGHTNIGAGRVVYQDLLRITKSFETNEAVAIPELRDFLHSIKEGTGRLHLLGLISDGGVHSHMSHIKSILLIAKMFGLKDIYIHAFTDGRDTPPTSGVSYIEELHDFMTENEVGQIADVSGRYYSMDRDKRWDRTKLSYEMLVNSIGDTANFAVDAVRQSYSVGVTDEFIRPTVVNGVNGCISDGDGVLFMNFRADRGRQLLEVMYDDNFSEFATANKPKVQILTMTEYDATIPVNAIYKAEPLKNILGEVLSNHGVTQLRIAETEKYAHVTYFFNGGSEAIFKGEDRVMIPSPRDVATYDLKPEMCVDKVVSEFRGRFKSGDVDVVIMNFANPDMVGHTGVLDASIAACKAVDKAIGEVMQIADEEGAVLFITADHGNIEQLWDYDNNQPLTSHTTNPVHLIAYNYDCEFNRKRGKLADIAPTILKVLGIDIPDEMTGDCLLD